MKNKVVIISATVVSVLLLIIGLIAGWKAYTGSPTYALKQILASIEDRDYDLFEEYVNIDDLLTSIVNEAGTLTKESSDSEGLGELGAALGGALVEAMMPTIKKEIKKQISSGTFVTDTSGLYGSDISLSNYKIKSIKKKRSIYTVSLSVPLMVKGCNSTISMVFKKDDGKCVLNEVKISEYFLDEVEMQKYLNGYYNKSTKEILDGISVSFKRHYYETASRTEYGNTSDFFSMLMSARKVSDTTSCIEFNIASVTPVKSVATVLTIGDYSESVTFTENFSSKPVSLTRYWQGNRFKGEKVTASISYAVGADGTVISFDDMAYEKYKKDTSLTVADIKGVVDNYDDTAYSSYEEFFKKVTK